MKTNPILRIATSLLSLSILLHTPLTFAQGTAFSYQGRLDNGGLPYTGSAEFQATLWDAASGGTVLVSNTPSQVIVGVTNGLFVLPLDFGANYPGAARWLQLEVRTTIGNFTTLAPRQQITPTPYALTASNLSGTLPAVQLSGAIPSVNLSGTYSGAVTFDHAANHFIGVHIGDGGSLSNVNATTLGGLGNAAFWQTGGNAGTTPGVHFLGTTDNQPLEVRVNNERALRLEFHPNASGFSSPSPNVIGGHAGNGAAPGVSGATIFGGGTNWFGATSPQRVSGDFSTIGGGIGHEVQAVVSTIAGGERGFIGSNAYNAFIGGGAWNSIYAPDATLGGGRGNVIQTNAFYATIPGGYNNRAAGQSSFAAGQSAQALHAGSFVWADGSGADFPSTANNQFSVRAAGGVRLVTSGAGLAVDGQAVALRAGGNAFTGQQTVTGGNVGIGTGTPQALLHVVGNVRIGADNGDYRQLRLGGGNSAGFLYGSFPALGDGIHVSYNHFYNAAGSGQVINTGGATSRVTVGYGFVGLYIGGVNAAPVTQRLLANSAGVTVNGTFNNSSDRDAKQDFAPVSPLQVLEKVLELPIAEWSYKEDPATRHLGPVAQDFHAAFSLGTDDKHIAPLDEGGVALAAIQGLNEKVEVGSAKAEVRIQNLEADNAELKTRLGKLEQLLDHTLKGNAK